MKIEVTWNKPDGTKPVVGFQTQPNDPNADDDEMQMQKSVAGARAHFHQKFGAAPPLKQLSVQTFSVNFTFLPLTDPRLQREMTKASSRLASSSGGSFRNAARPIRGFSLSVKRQCRRDFKRWPTAPSIFLPRLSRWRKLGVSCRPFCESFSSADR